MSHTGRTALIRRRRRGPVAAPPAISLAPAVPGPPLPGVPVSAYSVNIGSQWDFVFRPELFATAPFGRGSGAVPTGLQHYVFVPATIHAQPGQVVTVYNSDQILHHIITDDSSFDTGVMNPGGSFTVTAGKAGSVISYHCTLHSRVKGKIVVDAPAQQ